MVPLGASDLVAPVPKALTRREAASAQTWVTRMAAVAAKNAAMVKREAEEHIGAGAPRAEITTVPAFRANPSLTIWTRSLPPPPPTHRTGHRTGAGWDRRRERRMRIARETTTHASQQVSTRDSSRVLHAYHFTVIPFRARIRDSQFDLLPLTCCYFTRNRTRNRRAAPVAHHGA